MVEECSTVPQLLKFAISWLLLKEKLPREKNGNLSKPCYTRHWAKRIITKRKVFRLSSSRKHKRLKASYNRRNRSSNASGAESFCKCSALTQEDQDAFDSSLLSAWDLSFSVVWNRDLRKLCNFLSYRKMLVESYLNHTSFWSFRQMTLWRLWTKWRYGVIWSINAQWLLARKNGTGYRSRTCGWTLAVDIYGSLASASRIESESWVLGKTKWLVLVQLERNCGEKGSYRTR